MITAVYRDFAAGAQENDITANSPDEAARVIDILAHPKIGSAVITHHGRPPWGEGPDHQVVIVVDGEHGAMYYSDRDNPPAHTRGHTAEEWEDENVTFPAEAWVPRALLAEALAEFVASGRRPTQLTWHTVSRTGS
ncbi:hypothetical protein GCM10022247_68470 [Allokutzneria multivorans]|uniref:Immunity protein Imm1 n=1 Tax=Allokutzneria multivorans TaxID=1142134 RepID=A0ABP7U058_9PSEU